MRLRRSFASMLARRSSKRPGRGWRRAGTLERRSWAGSGPTRVASGRTEVRVKPPFRSGRKTKFTDLPAPQHSRVSADSSSLVQGRHVVPRSAAHNDEGVIGAGEKAKDWIAKNAAGTPVAAPKISEESNIFDLNDGS
jgi:hypothetical protein